MYKDLRSMDDVCWAAVEYAVLPLRIAKELPEGHEALNAVDNLESKEAIRKLAKLYLNSLYGKMAGNTDNYLGLYPATVYNKKGFVYADTDSIHCELK